MGGWVVAPMISLTDLRGFVKDKLACELFNNVRILVGYANFAMLGQLCELFANATKRTSWLT